MDHHKRAIIVLIDGARPDVLRAEMEAGHLPTLSRLAEQGTFQTIVTAFPSTTGPAYLPFITGQFPGSCNIPGIRWFDKAAYAQKGWGFGQFRSYVGFETRFLDGDINPHVKTAWEIFDRPKNILNGVCRGLPPRGDLTRRSRGPSYLLGHFTRCWKLVDHIAYKKLLNVAQSGDFDFVFCVFPGVDEYAHRGSPFDARVRKPYAQVDIYLGDVVQALKNKGLLDDTLIAVVSDHGSSEVEGHFDVGPWLSSHLKLKTFDYPNIFKKNFKAASMVSGNGMAHVYFETKRGWGHRALYEEILNEPVNIIDELLNRKEVDLLAMQGEGGCYHVLSRRGHGRFSVEEQSGRINYTLDGQDPLGIFEKNDERLNQAFTLASSMQQTLSTEYPDIFAQLWQIFQSNRTGDIVVSARKGFDLRDRFECPQHFSGHGALHRDHMLVPFILNHHLPNPIGRSIDVLPLIMKMCGKDYSSMGSTVTVPDPVSKNSSSP